MSVLISPGATPQFLLILTTLSTLDANFYEQLILLRVFNIQSCYTYSILRQYTYADNVLKECNVLFKHKDLNFMSKS